MILSHFGHIHNVKVCVIYTPGASVDHLLIVQRESKKGNHIDRSSCLVYVFAIYTLVLKNISLAHSLRNLQ